MKRAMMWTSTALLLSGCLPVDTRPEPGSVFVTAEPSPAVLSGISTADGWQISFERLLIGLGNVHLSDDGVHGSCNSAPYDSDGYLRILDLSTAGPQKLADVFALGTCGLHLGISWPPNDSLLGAGVSMDDTALFLDYTIGRYECGLGPTDSNFPDDHDDAAVYVRGQASRGTSIKRFAWALPQEGIVLECPAADGQGDVRLDNDFTLHGGDVFRPSIVIQVEELFRAGPEAGAPLRFDPVADADANGDETITMAELTQAPAPAGVDDSGRLYYCAPSSLADFVATRVASLLHLGNGGACLDQPELIE